jgi:hypothetical protein
MKLSSIFSPPGARAKLAGLLAISAMALVLSVSSANACSYGGAEQVFSRWGDQHHCVLGPDGGFDPFARR